MAFRRVRSTEHGYESVLDDEAIASYPEGTWDVLDDDTPSAPVTAASRRQTTGIPDPDASGYADDASDDDRNYR